MKEKWDKIEWLAAIIIIIVCWIGDISLWIWYIIGDMPYWGNAFAAFILCTVATCYLIFCKKDFKL